MYVVRARSKEHRVTIMTSITGKMDGSPGGRAIRVHMAHGPLRSSWASQMMPVIAHGIFLSRVSCSSFFFLRLLPFRASRRATCDGWARWRRASSVDSIYTNLPTAQGMMSQIFNMILPARRPLGALDGGFSGFLECWKARELGNSNREHQREAGSRKPLRPSFVPTADHSPRTRAPPLTTTALDSLGTGDTGSRQPCSSRRAQRFRSPSRETPRRTNTKLTVARLSGSARAPGQSQLFESLSPDKSGHSTRYMPCARRLLRLHSAFPVSSPR